MTSQLIFFPESTDKIISQQPLLTGLINLQLISKKPHSDNHYLPGEHFLSCITFLGCSPSINLQPVKDESHCFISIIKPTQEVVCLGYTQSINPKCPACKKRINNWKTPDWKKAGETCTCDKCQAQTPYTELNWKHECGFAKCGFEINNIYPHEAVPTDTFLENLCQFSNFEWNYAYSNNL